MAPAGPHIGPHCHPVKFGCIYVDVCVCVCLHASALIDEAQGREHAIKWATWMFHAALTRLKCVEQQREECEADRTCVYGGRGRFRVSRASFNASELWFLKWLCCQIILGMLQTV